MPETRPFTLYSARLPQPPIAARDERGRDVLDRVRTLDRRYADGFALERVRGYAAEHTLTLTLPPPGPGGRRLLLLTGWTDYAFSGDNVAAHQAGLRLLPPSLEIKAADGTWKTVIDDIGMPVGRPQTVAVDLSAAVPAATTEVRIRTSMRIYWDQILVDSSDGRAPTSVTRLEPVTATLRWRGFSAEHASRWAGALHLRLRSRLGDLAVEAPARPLHARGRRPATAPRHRRHVRRLAPGRRDRDRVRRDRAAAAAAGLDTHVPALRRRLQQGDEPALRRAPTPCCHCPSTA